MDNMPVNTDVQVRPAAARPPLLGRRLLSRYEASALSACSLKTIVRCIRSSRAGGLGGRAVGAAPWSLFRGRLGGCSGTPHARLLGERVASTRGISSLAQSHGAQRISAAACSVSPVLVGARAADARGGLMTSGAMRPCSRQHRRFATTASHNWSAHTDPQLQEAASPRRLRSGGLRRYTVRCAPGCVTFSVTCYPFRNEGR
jgi:hypothetical protein